MGADSIVAHHERRELIVLVIIIAVILILSSTPAYRARGVLGSPEQNDRALQETSPMKVSMMFAIIDAEGSAVTEEKEIVEINSEGLAKIEVGLIESKIDGWGTGLCDG